MAFNILILTNTIHTEVFHKSLNNAVAYPADLRNCISSFAFHFYNLVIYIIL